MYNRGYPCRSYLSIIPDRKQVVQYRLDRPNLRRYSLLSPFDDFAFQYKRNLRGRHELASFFVPVSRYDAAAIWFGGNTHERKESKRKQ
jgi:hypothetical protein